MNIKVIVRDKAQMRGDKFLTDNNTALSAITSYAPIKAKWDAGFTLTQKAKQKMYEQYGYITFDKKLLRAEMINIFLPQLAKGSSQMFVADRLDLAKALDINPSYLIQCGGEACIGRATDLLNIVTTNSTVITSITVTDRADMTDALKAFKEINGTPQSLIKKRKAEGTEIMIPLLNDLDVTKHFLTKHISSHNPDLLADWLAVIKVGKSSAARHLSLEIKLVDDVTGVAVVKGEVTLIKGIEKYKKFSSTKGFARFYSVMVGTWSFAVDSELYETVSMSNIGIDNTKTVRFTIKLKKKNY